MPGEKSLGTKEGNNIKLNPHMTSMAIFEPGRHWWEASALTTAPSLAARRPTECEVLTARPRLQRRG